MATDYRMQNHVDPTAVAGLYLRKSEIENQQEALEIQKRNQNLREVEATAGAVSSLTAGMIAKSKERQKRDFINAMADSMAAMEAEKAGKEGRVPASREGIHGAINLNPEKASQIYLDQQFPDPNKNGSGQRYQQSAIETAGPDGAPRTVFVTFDTETGQQVDPRTLQPITDKTDLSTLNTKGYAQGFRPAGFSIDGKEVVASVRNGQKFIVENNQYVPYNDTIYPKLENVPTGLTDSMAELKYSQEVLERITQTFDPDYVGPVAARAGKISKFVDALTEEQKVEFYGNVAEYKNSIIKAITGAQMSEIEAKRIIQQIPDENAAPKAFLAGLKRASISANNRIAAKQRAMKEGGYVSRGETINAEALNQLLDKKFDKITKSLPAEQPQQPPNIEAIKKRIQELEQKAGQP